MYNFINRFCAEKIGLSKDITISEAEQREIESVLAQCGLYDDIEMKEKIKECKNNTYIIKLSKEFANIAKINPISIGIIGCKRIFLKDLLDPIINSIPVDLKYHPQKNDVIYSIEFLHISTINDLITEDVIPKIVKMAINNILVDKNDAPVFIDLRCISKYVDDYYKLMDDLKFEYVGDNEEGFFVRYPITNSKF